jgi:hypothetical protein
MGTVPAYPPNTVCKTFNSVDLPFAPGSNKDKETLLGYRSGQAIANSPSNKFNYLDISLKNFFQKRTPMNTSENESGISVDLAV